MPLLIMTADSYDQVRAALDLSVDANVVSDATIEMPIYGGAAENEVLAREALVTGIDPVKQAAHREQAAIYLTAARLAFALPALTGERFGDWQMTRAAAEPAAQAACLRGLAERELAAYLETSGQPAVLKSFWLAAGRRGR